MKTRFVIISLTAVLGALSAYADFDEEPYEAIEKAVRVVSEGPVFKAGVPGDVKVTLKNTKDIEIWLKGPVVVQNDDDPTNEVLAEIHPGNVLLPKDHGLTFLWNKKDKNGNYVVPGSYSIDAPVKLPEAEAIVSFQVVVAITPTGRISASQPMPLWKWNKWTYRNVSGFPADPLFPKILVADKTGPWYTLTNWAGAKRKVQLTGTTVRVKSSDGNVVDLFRLNHPVNQTYLVSLPPYLKNAKIKVASTNATAYAPQWTIKECTRFDVVQAEGAEHYRSFWFLPGFGLVRSSRKGPQGKTYISSLNAAWLMSPDGKDYRVAHYANWE